LWLPPTGRLQAGGAPDKTDAYGVLPPSMMRQNPPEYHALIEATGFETEKSVVDYAVEIELVPLSLA